MVTGGEVVLRSETQPPVGETLVISWRVSRPEVAGERVGTAVQVRMVGEGRVRAT